MDFEQLINNLRNKLDDSTKGSVSEDLLAIVGELRSQKQTISDNTETINKLKSENEELLKTNGRLFQKIGFDKKEEEKIIPWRSWCGIRDIFAHQYYNLDFESAWDSIQNDLPELQKNVIRILEEKNR